MKIRAGKRTSGMAGKERRRENGNEEEENKRKKNGKVLLCLRTADRERASARYLASRTRLLFHLGVGGEEIFLTFIDHYPPFPNCEGDEDERR